MAGLQNSLQARKLTLVVSLPANDAKLARAALEEGADGLKVHMNVGHRASGNRFGSLDEYENTFREIRSLFEGPLGIVPAGGAEEAKPEEIGRLSPLGFDFYSIYAHHLPSFMLHETGLDRTFAVNEFSDLALLSSASRYGFTAVEASIVPGDEYGTPLTFADVLKYRSVVERAGIPVLLPSQRKLVPDDVRVLGDTGIKAIMLGAIVVGKTEETMRRAVADFRAAIDRWN
ncbi:hypothetical protein [Cohnella phaseoli]|uniref:hypothetical protein n=1 Tax=Cohnella phaseoli TaxID=456490 RepID=UPI000E254233|nr:hypothetical protein [Cohnella phaseoli]